MIVKYKVPGNVNVIGGISRDRVTNLVFDGRMDGPGFESLMKSFLLPFIPEKMPDFHIIHMDSAPLHTAAESFRFLENNNINHRPFPALSPDMNAIELVWHDLKVWLSNVWIPKTRVELILAIHIF